MMSASNAPLLLPQGVATQTLLGFNAQAIENGFIVSKNYYVQESGRPPAQLQRTLYFPTLKEVVENLSSDVSE